MPVVTSGAVLAGSGALQPIQGAVVPYPGGQSVAEAAGHQSQLESTLKAGLSVVSENQTVTFVLYYKVVLPLDGFVFWVRAGLLGPGAQLNTSRVNTFGFNVPPQPVSPPPQQLVAAGSLHISTTSQQDENESFSINRMTFTSKVEVNDLNDIAPGSMYIAQHGPYKFAFAGRSGYYRQADLYHYTGDAVYPVMESQIIDNAQDLDTRDVVVSNSLPLWLAMNALFPVYPSFLVPDNIPPPYLAVDIPEDATDALQPIPYIDPGTSSHWQLARDRVKVTMYGLRNNQALDYMDYVLSTSTLGNFGIMSAPVIRDAKRTQVELGVIAMKKVLRLDVSYYQTRVRDVALALIKQAIPTFIVAE